MQAASESKQWHIANWGFLGWLETGIKAAGIITGIFAFAQLALAGSVQFPGMSFSIPVIILIVLCLLTCVVVALRASQREIISLIFALANVAGHAGMLYYLLHTPDAKILPLIFSLAYVSGELVKQRYLIVTGYTEAGQETPQMLMFSRGLMTVYILLAVFALI